MTNPDLATRLRAAIEGSGDASSDFDLNPDTVLPAGRVLRPAAVLVAVSQATGEVLLTKRSSRLRHHPGQIAFPGGRQDPEDADLEATALREAHEEVGLSASLVTVLGRLPTHETVTSFRVTPVVAMIDGHFDPTPEAGEVEEVFSVPLSHVVDPSNFQIEWRYWRGQKRHYFTVTWGPYYIWGATARILRGLADRMA